MIHPPGDGVFRFTAEGGFLIIEAGTGDRYNRIQIHNGSATINFNTGDMTFTNGTEPVDHVRPA